MSNEHFAHNFFSTEVGAVLYSRITPSIWFSWHCNSSNVVPIDKKLQYQSTECPQLASWSSYARTFLKCHFCWPREDPWKMKLQRLDIFWKYIFKKYTFLKCIFWKRIIQKHIFKNSSILVVNNDGKNHKWRRNKLASLEATLVRNYEPLTDRSKVKSY